MITKYTITHTRAAAHRVRRGFTLVEMAIVATILILLSGALVSSLESLRDATLTSSVESKLQEAGEKAMRQIVDDLRRSGVVTVDFGAGLVAYPGFFFDGDTAATATSAEVNAMHAHPAPVQNAVAGDPDFGASREIVFLQPLDADTWGPPAVVGVPDGIPDLDANADLVWDPTEFSYVLVTGVDGINRLERRTNGINPTTVASFVERVVFENNAFNFAIPLSAVRIRIFLRQVDSQGVVHRYQTDATVQLRNGL